ncbi:MAG: ABC-F family ATP-binding cassette domain-containing protein [SAR202 cluster bacterium]|nr:ABC-F family ATP-binding cassette domain-containing protein [SAR202 cluster bacterium]
MPTLSASQLRLFYGEIEVFSGISLDVHEQARVGIVGPNGGGKTSLLRVLTGELEPNGGSVSRARSLRIGHVSQIPDAARDGTLHDEIMIAFDGLLKLEHQLATSAADLEQSDDDERRQAERRYSSLLEQYESEGGYDYMNRMERVVAGVGLARDTLETPSSMASGGERTRAALARALLTDPDLLVLDEPTNYLDFDGLDWLEGFLSSFDYSVVVVSHDRYFLDRVATEIWEMDHGRLQRFPGNYSKYRELKQAQVERQQKDFDSQQEFIAKEESFIQRYMAGQRTKEARGRQTRLGRMERIDAPERDRSIRISAANATRTGGVVLGIRGLKVGFVEDAKSVELVSIPKIELERGSRTAIVGANGIGKTTLLRTILGQQQSLAGSIALGHNVDVGYLQQGTDDLPDGRSVLDALIDIRNLQLVDARSYLARFLFTGDDVFKQVAVLSGGERTRLALARLLITEPNVLILDEPTTHLDIPSREALEDTLSNYSGALLFVSHDRHFISLMADQIWSIEDGVAKLFPGTFPEWVQSKQPAVAPLVSKRAKARQRRRVRETKKQERAAEPVASAVDHGATIEKLEARIARIERQLAEASASQDIDKIADLGKKHQVAQKRLERAWQAWSG